MSCAERIRNHIITQVSNVEIGPEETMSNRPDYILTAMFVGNQRLRFAIALNLNRYRYAINRKTKRKVVDSILQQIESAGGRFLEKASTHEEDHLIVVCAKVSRLKVSHALRDKIPLNAIQKAKIRLRELFKHHTMKNEDSEENVYNAINAMIFHTSLDHHDNTCGNHVEKVLGKLIIDFLQTIIGRRKDNENASVHCMTKFNCMQEIENCVRENRFSLVNRIMILASLASETRMKIPFDIECKMQCRSFEGSNKKFFHDQVSETDSIFVEDLPQTFTADDCEQLVASLDSK
jgi:hypothetical protein